MEEINLEYELLYREEIVSNLYRPQENVIIIEDFRDLMPQLLHIFIRDPEKFKESEIAKIHKTTKDAEEIRKRIAGLDTKLDPAVVNHVASIDAVYSDSPGFGRYISNTENQISASLFSPAFFIEGRQRSLIGIGFNSDSMTPESIMLSSQDYMTTNAGVYNIDNSNDSNHYNSSYAELIQNDGKSEVVLARRGEDFDTKAAYVFVALSGENIQEQELYKRAKLIADKNSLKLVVYDLTKISKSYESNLGSELVEEVETKKVSM